MNKQDLIKAVAEQAEITAKQASEAVDTVFASITEALVRNEKVSVAGFGIFDVKIRKERMGIIPRTNEKITIPEAKAPIFKPGKQLKDKVDQ